MSDSIPSVAVMREREPESNKLNLLVFKHRYIFSGSTGYSYLVASLVTLVGFMTTPTIVSAVGTALLLFCSMAVFTLAKRKQNLIERGDIIYLPRYYGELGVWQKNLKDYISELEKLRQGALKSNEVRSAYMRLEPLAWENIKKSEVAIRALRGNDKMDSNTKGQYQRDLAQLIESEKHLESAHEAANGLVLERARAIIDPEPSREVSTNINAQLSALRQLGSGD